MLKLPGGVTVTVILVESIHNFSNFNLLTCTAMLRGTPSQVRSWPASSEGHLKENVPPFKMVSILTTLREVNGHLRPYTA